MSMNYQQSRSDCFSNIPKKIHHKLVPRQISSIWEGWTVGTVGGGGWGDMQSHSPALMLCLNPRWRRGDDYAENNVIQ